MRLFPFREMVESSNLKISQVIPDAVMPEALASGIAAFGEQTNISIGEFDPGSG